MTKTTRTWAICIVLCLLSFFKLVAQDQTQYKEYSYTELFQMIEDEEDSVFELKNALIIPDGKSDITYKAEINFADWSGFIYPKKDSTIIDKALILNNMNFSPEAGIENQKTWYKILSYIHFKRSVTLINVSNFMVAGSTFEEHVSVTYDREGLPSINHLSNNLGYQQLFWLSDSHFLKGIDVGAYQIGQDRLNFQFLLTSSKIYPSPSKFDQFIYHTYIYFNNIYNFNLIGNQFIGKGAVRLNVSEPSESEIVGNTFEEQYVILMILDLPNSIIKIADNKFGAIVGLDFKGISENTSLDWEQLKGKTTVFSSLSTALSLTNKEDSLITNDWTKLESLDYYANILAIENTQAYKAEQKLKGQLFKHYKNQNDNEFANAVYIESKDLETKRLAFLYRNTPTFKTFFSWKINQFLRVFSAYGTEPARAIIFSVYVIIAFALIYLFFPNHWDAHGKDRILHRYQFFFKYLNKDAGMHEVYLEGKQDELAHYDGFKNFFIENGKTVPKFFLATALPLYRWSIASTRSTSWFLQKIDIFKGKWADLPAPQRAAKTVLLTLAFALALLYDIFIKMLNALMLSINTFTTLGFGEIPIKGIT
jgi:hypothetical protein